MDHRNKIQSLVLPKDDPGDAQDCMCEYGPCTCEHGRMCRTAPTAQRYRVSLQPTLHLAFLVRPEPSKSMPATNYGQQSKNHKTTLVGPQKSPKYFFDKVRNFSVLDEGDCQRTYRADWEPEAPSGKCMGRVPGVFWRCPAAL